MIGTMPKEYIEREKIIELTEEIKDNFAPLHRKVIDAFIYNINKNIPTADVEPVRHGEWKFLGDNYAKCTNCETLFEALPNTFAFEANNLYCRHCGARMDRSNKRNEI